MSSGILNFNEEYYYPILNGRKIQTMRLNDHSLKVGDIVTAKFNESDKILKLRITKTGYRKFNSITPDDARAEGFETAGELKEELNKIYNGLEPWDRLYYYRFEVVRMCDNYRLAFNINVTNDEIFDKLETNLENSKNVMEFNKDINFYLSICYNSGDYDEFDLNKISNVELCDDGIVLHSLKTFSVSIIPYKSIKLVELVEKK